MFILQVLNKKECPNLTKINQRPKLAPKIKLMPMSLNNTAQIVSRAFELEKVACLAPIVPKLGHRAPFLGTPPLTPY